METPFVSIIVVNYNGKRHLGACLATLETSDYPKERYEVIMVDNGSFDGSAEVVARNFPSVKILKLGKNYGFCRPNNEGARIARGDYLIFLNNDTFVTPDWLKNIVRPLAVNKNVLSAGCKILKPYTIGGSAVIDYAGSKIAPDGSGIIIGMMDTDREEYNIPRACAYGSGAGVIVEKKFFLDTGGFDEYFFMGYEEMDLGLRVWLTGHKVLYEPKGIMYHYRAATYGGPLQPYIFKKNVKNRLYFILKNFQPKTALIFLFFAICSNGLQFFFFLFTGKGRISAALIKGSFLFLRDIRRERLIERIAEKRSQMNRIRKISDTELFRNGLISGFREKASYGRRYIRQR